MNFNEMLEQMRREYVAELPQKMEHIRKNFAAGDYAQLLEDFHKLKGTGTTYGLPEITELGALVEEICEDIPANGPQALPLALELLQAIFEQRSNAKAFDILSDPRFSKLKGLTGKTNGA